MENIQEVEGMLEQVDDAGQAGLVAAAADPLWVWPIVGVLAGVFLASFALENSLLSAGATLLYLVGIGAVVGFVVRRRGVQPKMGEFPPALRREFAYYSVGVCVVLAGVLGVSFMVNFYAGGVATFVLVTIGGIWYHLRWRAAVKQIVNQ